MVTGGPLPTTSSISLERAAYAYAKRGMRVIPLHNLEPDGKCSCDAWRTQQGFGPCRTPGKHPRFRQWAEKGTTDPRRIAEWWKVYPNANIGVVSGRRSNLIVLDTDPRNGGTESRGRLIREIGALPECATCATGGGGMHEHFAWPEDLETTQSVVVLDDGLEVLLEAHNVVMPPSYAHIGRQPYIWDLGEGIPVAPTRLVDLVKSKLQAVAAGARSASGGAGWPLADIGQILSGCEWMRYCSEHAAALTEPEWHAQLSIVGRCENGEQLAHDLSSPYPGYSAAETAAKLRHAVADAGPATCARICHSLGGARFCEHCTARVKSPVVLGISRADRAKEKSPESGPVTAKDEHYDGGDRPPAAIDTDIPPPEDGDLPRIIVNNRQLRDVSDEALAALQRSNRLSPRIFVRGGKLVAVIRDEGQRRIIYELTEWSLRGHLARSANYMKRGPSGDTHCHPGVEVVRDILSLEPARWQLQSLDAVVEAPVLRADGSILDSPGYDPQTRLYYAPDPSLCVPPIPEEPTQDHIEAAVYVVHGAIGEFPYADEASYANAFAATLTPIVRPAIDASAPMALLDAPQAGTGKSLLADVISIVATGRPGEMFSAPRDPDEWRKQITTALASGTAVVVIDNVVGRLDNADLCKVLTETIHADRAFRTHEKMLLPVKATFIATGNNIALSGDMPRRCYWVRLDAKSSRPFLRTGFKIDDLKAWASVHRGELLWALLTLARAWFVARRPKPQLTPLGSFELWSTVVGGILEHAGIDGFLRNSDELYDVADSDAGQWQAFLEALSDVFMGDQFTVAELFEKLRERVGEFGRSTEFSATALRLREALPDYVAEGLDKGEGAFKRRIGRCFGERVGRRYGPSQLFLGRGAMTHNSQRWFVELPGGQR